MEGSETDVGLREEGVKSGRGQKGGVSRVPLRLVISQSRTPSV
jgi:hypothetical protein